METGAQTALGAKIATARSEAELTQGALARALGIRLGILDRLERGLLDPAPYLERIAQLTGKSVEWFLGEAVPESRLGEDLADLSDRQRVLSEREKRLARQREMLERKLRELREARTEHDRAAAELAEREAILADKEARNIRVRRRLLGWHSRLGKEREELEVARGEIAARAAAVNGHGSEASDSAPPEADRDGVGGLTGD